MSSAPEPVGEGVPCPREVWAAARNARRVTITVEPDSRSVERGNGRIRFTGDITEVRKKGDAWNTYVTIQMVPDGELGAVELEAGKEGGEWDPFRAFQWRQPGVPEGPEDHRFQYVGAVVALEIHGVQLDAATATEDPEVSA